MQQAFHTLWRSNQLAPSPTLLWSGAALTLSVLAPGIHYATPSQCECVLAAGRQGQPVRTHWNRELGTEEQSDIPGGDLSHGFWDRGDCSRGASLHAHSCTTLAVSLA